MKRTTPPNSQIPNRSVHHGETKHEHKLLLPHAIGVWLQSGPPELMTASACHVIATAVFYNVFSTTRATLHHFAEYIWKVNVSWRRNTSLARGPLMFAHETHNCVMATIAQTRASWTRTVNVQFSWVIWVRFQPTPQSELSLKSRNCFIASGGMRPDSVTGRTRAAQTLPIRTLRRSAAW